MPSSLVSRAAETRATTRPVAHKRREGPTCPGWTQDVYRYRIHALPFSDARLTVVHRRRVLDNRPHYSVLAAGTLPKSDYSLSLLFIYLRARVAVPSTMHSVPGPVGLARRSAHWLGAARADSSLLLIRKMGQACGHAVGIYRRPLVPESEACVHPARGSEATITYVLTYTVPGQGDHSRGRNHHAAP